MKYHGSEPLTYASTSKLKLGTIVQTTMRRARTLGIVFREVQKPVFTVKPVAAIADFPPIPQEMLELLDWLASYYPAPFGTIVRQFLPPTTVLPKTTDPKTTTNTAASLLSLPPLTLPQQKAISQMRPVGYNLLHGITGSGKTRIYQELSLAAIQKGRAVILLTPEIGLTGQLAAAFSGLSDVPVRVIHSRLRPTQRRTLWYEILATHGPQIILGPRSTLFAPIQNVGLIIIDESHDPSYKSDSAPHYRTERVAAKLASLHGAMLVSGTATPTIEEYFIAKQKAAPIISLAETALPRLSKKQVSIIDMRQESNRSGSPLLSTPLIEAMRQTIAQSRQCLLFLNRRGTANSILCSNCGWQALCAYCDLPLTYHADKHTTVCHQCGRNKSMSLSCPDCQNTDILLRSYGTKALVDEAQKYFPNVALQRFDTDTQKDNQLEKTIDILQRGDVQILIGTQMIAKGLDLPKLSLVGILNADSGLALPDYTAAERTNFLLNQVAGRIGRGHDSAHPGRLFVQTYRPENQIVLNGANQDWQAFYRHELTERRAYHFPPFQFMLKLSCSRATNAGSERTAASLATVLREQKGIAVEGPAPAFYAKSNGKFTWNVIVKSSSRTNLISVIKLLPSGWSYDIDPISLL